MLSGKKISVIMPSCLSPYEYKTESGVVVKSASNPVPKFIRAVNSFLAQTYPNKELIIVADGCELTNSTVRGIFAEHLKTGLINLVSIPKQELFSGHVRNMGLKNAKGDIIAHLDSDDSFYTVGHLDFIANGFDTDKYDWVMWNDMIDVGNNVIGRRNVMPVHGSIGTSSFAYKSSIKAKWGNGYGHDFGLVKEYLLDKPCKHLGNGLYMVHHVSGLGYDN